MGFREFAYGWAKREDPKVKRQEQSIALMEKLAALGLEPNEINQTVKQYQESGEFSLPTTREVRAEGPATEQGYLPTVQEPVKFKRKQGGIWVPGEDGKYEFQQAPEGVESVNVAQPGIVDVLDADGNIVRQARRGSVRLPDSDGGYDIYVDAKTGEEIKREPNGSGRNKVIKIGSSGNSWGFGGRDPIQEKVAKLAIDKFIQAEKEGSVNEDIRRDAADAAEYLGFPTKEIVTQPASDGFLGFGKKEEVRSKVPSFTRGQTQAPKAQGMGQTKVINGVTYKKGSDGKWHKQK